MFEHGYTGSRSGTGFALAIVRSVIEAHDWKIDLVAAESGGARFEVAVPTVERTNDPMRAELRLESGSNPDSRSQRT